MAKWYIAGMRTPNYIIKSETSDVSGFEIEIKATHNVDGERTKHTQEVDKSIADLVTAAPELLAAAITVADTLEGWAEHSRIKHRNLPDSDPECEKHQNMDANYMNLVNLIRGAIAKAEGK
jgi:hypothetical protein